MHGRATPPSISLLSESEPSLVRQSGLSRDLGNVVPRLAAATREDLCLDQLAGARAPIRVTTHLDGDAQFDNVAIR